MKYWLNLLLGLLTMLLPALNGSAAAFPEKKAAKEPITVYIFLSETCPISQFYTLTLKELHQAFADENLKFTGVFPNAESTPETIAEFKARYSLPFSLLPDPKQELTKALKAGITPEVVVKNEVSGEILYKGRIDNSYFRVGKRRDKVTEEDLKKALTEIKNNQKVSNPISAAVGCYITLLP